MAEIIKLNVTAPDFFFFKEMNDNNLIFTLRLSQKVLK